jgi:hypothetical protein
MHLQSVNSSLPSEDVIAKGHGVQVDALVALNEPVAQVKHVSTDVALIDALNFPAAHSVHATDPTVALNVPTVHAVQSVGLVPLNPAMHLQSVNSSLPDADIVLKGHVKQALTAVRPVISLYVPDAHCVHAPVPFPTLYVPAVHAIHSGLSSANVCPCIQSVHALSALPGSEYFDWSGQAVQFPPATLY